MDKLVNRLIVNMIDRAHKQWPGLISDNAIETARRKLQDHPEVVQYALEEAIKESGMKLVPEADFRQAPGWEGSAEDQAP